MGWLSFIRLRRNCPLLAVYSCGWESMIACPLMGINDSFEVIIKDDEERLICPCLI